MFIPLWTSERARNNARTDCLSVFHCGYSRTSTPALKMVLCWMSHGSQITNKIKITNGINLYKPTISIKTQKRQVIDIHTLQLPTSLKRQTLRRIPSNFDISRDLRLSKDLTLGDDNTLFTRVIRKSGPNLSTVIIATIHRAQSDGMRIANFGKAWTIPSRISTVWPGSVSLLACVFSDETGQESGRDGFKGWDRRG